METHDKSVAELEKAFVDFESAQKEQLAALQEGDLKNVLAFNDRRVKVFSYLQRCLEKISKEAKALADMDFLNDLQQRLEQVLGVEKILDIAAADCQKVLVENLGDLRKGKTAVKGYSSRYGRSPGARFTSSMG